MNVGNIVAKGVGATALFLIGRDAHVWGKIRAEENKKTKGAAAAAYYFNNTMTLDKPSVTKDKMQKAVFNFELGETIRGHINSTQGYIKGLFASLTSNVISFTLGATALLAKGKWSKGSAIALAAIGVYSFIKDGLGLGKTKDLNYPSE